MSNTRHTRVSDMPQFARNAPSDDLGSMHIPPTLSDWRIWMMAADHSQRTINDRIEAVRLLAARAPCNPASADWRTLAAFLADPEWKPGTRRTRFSQLRAYYRWLVLTEQRDDDPTIRLRKPKAPRGVPHPVLPIEVAKVLAAANRRRTHGMVVLAICTGFRVHEIAKFRGEDLRSGRVWVIGKGGTDASLPAHPMLEAEAEGFPRVGWWFPSPTRPGRPVTARNVSKVLSSTIERAGVHASAHGLRHFFGTETLRSSGGNLRVTQELMRHASPGTTAIYTKVDDTQMRSAVCGLPFGPLWGAA
jgi:integrase/recombinase XerD